MPNDILELLTHITGLTERNIKDLLYFDDTDEDTADARVRDMFTAVAYLVTRRANKGEMQFALTFPSYNFGGFNKYSFSDLMQQHPYIPIDSEVESVALSLVEFRSRKELNNGKD